MSWGELLDKITILQIKQALLSDPAKQSNVVRELEALTGAVDAQGALPESIRRVMDDLRTVNKELWRIEDDIRDCERRQDFGAPFVALARAVYHTNDRRAALKRQVNDLMGSDLVEEKSYAPYGEGG